ncbi:hypothetical protein DFJ43DRAFT_1044349 [Lentinula guzmanii]|uniref:Uncharacterized protein n=1 Tax=Lentinula guzmanii TaxID=2804957 RepID=A0AA38J5M5_9AGAR|nr:hypothetical protein DFJ43DRAFT_1044349 [Lentinula guzmanii]
MSTPSGAESTSTPVMTASEFEAWTLAPKLRLSAKHTNSTSTRPPSLYDKHIPKALQPKIIYLGKPHYQPDSSDISDPGFAIDHYYSQLCKRPDVLKSLTGTFIRHLSIQNEEGVRFAERLVAEIVYDLSSLLLFDLSKDQLENFGEWIALATHSNTETGTNADFLLGLHEKDAILERDSRNSSQSRCDGIWPLLTHLDLDFMQYIVVVECNNLRLGNPMGYLALLLLSCLSQKVQVDLWPEAQCHGCGEFCESHKVQFGHAPVQPPLDSPIASAYGLTAVPLHSEAAIVHQEIGRVIGLVLENHEPSAIVRDATEHLQGRPTDFGNFADLVREPMRNLLLSLEEAQTIKVLDQFCDKVDLLKDIVWWINRMRDIFVQACSQLIGHNLTFCIVTSYNYSYFFQRNRQTGEITMSPLQQVSKKGHIIQRAVLCSEAFYDSKDRSHLNQVKPVREN